MSTTRLLLRITGSSGFTDPVRNGILCGCVLAVFVLRVHLFGIENGYID